MQETQEDISQQPPTSSRGLQATIAQALADQTIRLGQELKTHFRMLASFEPWNRTIKQAYGLNQCRLDSTDPKHCRSKPYL